MNDINKQKPFTVSQISNDKPNIDKSVSILSGFIGNSMNGGHNKVIAWKKVMAGERHREYRLKLNMQMLTPKTPTYQNLSCTVRAYFVPNSRIWKNAEAYTAQKGGSAEIKIKEIPNVGGYNYPKAENEDGSKLTNLTNTEAWRDAFISSYYPRINQFGLTDNSPPNLGTLPKLSVLPLRGRIAIYNDFERNKEYEEEEYEYNDDTVSEEEFKSYLPIAENTLRFDVLNGRAKRQNSYYTDYRTEIQGFESSLPEPTSDRSLITWAAWESKIAEARSEAENAQLNDWQIIAKIRGSKMLSEGKVQLIGQKTFNLNYAAITQNTYNNSENVSEEFRVMGKQGAYSYTEVEFPIYAGMEFIEEGYVHFIATISADTVFEKAFDRNLLNCTPLDEYRPDLKDDKYDVLYNIEVNSEQPDDMGILGFKRKFSEYFKLPNVIAGDMTSDNYYTRQLGTSQYMFDENDQTITQKTFQFFEYNMNYAYHFDGNQNIVQSEKKIWKDYTDLLINKNQAIKNPWGYLTDTPTPGYQSVIEIAGQNQIFFVGLQTCLAELPIDESIINNYTTWGEH